jgi:protein-S-isoprenylcysteine O-methyltransferase Ste14
MLRDDLNNLFVKSLSLFGVLLAQSVRLFKSVSHFMMEIDFLSELLQVVIANFFINFSFYLIFPSSDLESRFYLIDSAVFVEVIFLLVSLRIVVLRWFKVRNEKVLCVILIINSIFQSESSDRF